MSWLGHVFEPALFSNDFEESQQHEVFLNSASQISNKPIERWLKPCFPNLKHAAFLGVVLGAVGPLLYYISQPAREYILGNGLFLWPTRLIIIVTYGHEHDWFAYVVTAIGIVP